MQAIALLHTEETSFQIYKNDIFNIYSWINNLTL